MNYFLRNRQFILVVALQVITVLLLLAVMHEKSTRKAYVLGDKFYGLQKEDCERIDKILNDETTANNVIEQNIGHYHFKKQLNSSTIGLRLDGGLTPEILSMIQKWESLKESEKDIIVNELQAEIQNHPKMKQLIQNFSEELRKIKETENWVN